jgi:signal transduction protein with GAF and PtsI domain
MITPEILNYILGILAIAGTAFGVYNYIRKPQEKGEINDAVTDEKIKAIVDNFNTRFQDMKDNIVKVMQNDLQEVKSELRSHVSNQSISEREYACKLGEISAKLDMIIKK